MVLMSQLTQRNLRQMLTFKQSFNTLLESKMKLPKGETIVKEISKLGKSKDVNALITGKANKFILYVDETKLDAFKSVKLEASMAVKALHNMSNEHPELLPSEDVACKISQVD